MKKRHQVLMAISAILLILLACTISLGGPTKEPTLSQEDLLNTAVAQTIAAGQQVVVPTATTGAVVEVPTQTLPVPPTNTPKPCNKAYFISETIPDGYEINPNTNFTKTWRWRNDGTCTWNTNYQLVFYSGEQMGGVAVKNFSQNVAPGEQVDISVDLKSPASAGSYRGYWKLRDDKGEYFVNTMYVDILVKSLVPVLPDLRITSFTINPATPTMGVPCTATITAYNGGGANAGGFTMRWYGLSTFTNPSCSWAFPGLAAGASQTETCTFTFGSWYPIDKTSIVYIDHDNNVAEANEGNNSASISPFGVVAP